MIEVPKTIICVDCGETAHLMSYPPEEGWSIGDYVAYRCRGCNDRWDLVVEDSDASSGVDGDPYGARAFLEERRDQQKAKD